MQTITARFAGECLRCGGDIAVGDAIHYQRGLGAAHAPCPEGAEADPKVIEQRRAEKADRALNYAANARERSEAAFDGARQIADQIPLGQPILVGHHSERRARRDPPKIQRGYERGLEEQKKAEHCKRKAQAAAEPQSISSLDPTAAEQLREKIAELEAEQTRMKAVNKALRSKDPVGEGAKLGMSEASVAKALDPDRRYSWEKPGYPAYALTNLAANIRRYKARLAELEEGE